MSKLDKIHHVTVNNSYDSSNGQTVATTCLDLWMKTYDAGDEDFGSTVMFVIKSIEEK
jgi:hypothetical protein